MAVYTVRVTWDLPAGREDYAEAGYMLWVIAQTSQVKSLTADNEGFIAEVEPGILLGEDEWLNALREAAGALKRVSVMVEKDGVVVWEREPGESAGEALRDLEEAL